MYVLPKHYIRLIIFITFVYGNTGPGRVSVYVTFEDATIGELNFRFTTIDNTN